MATAIFFNGKRINVPGAYSKIDASALASTSPAAVGIVALIGTAEGGKPLDVSEEFDMTRGGQVNERYRSGDLRTAAVFAFSPSTDQAIPNGASRIVPVKVNPSTQSSATIQDDFAADAADLLSDDYGLFTEGISLEIADGTTQGKLVTIAFEGETEVFDDVGGDSIFTALYTPGTDGYDSALASITSSAFSVAVSKAETGLAAEVTATIPAGLPAGLEVLSGDPGDVAQTVTVYGLVGTTATQETVTLNGTTPVPTAVVTWSKVLGAAVAGTTAGAMTLRVAGGGATALTIGAGPDGTAGVVQTTNTPLDSAGFPTVTIDTNDPTDMALFGETDAGVLTGERFDMTAGAAGVLGTVAMRKITVIALGEQVVGRTVTVTGNAVASNHSTFATVQKLVDRLNMLDGFTATAVVGNPTTFLLTRMDFPAAAVSILTPAKGFLADLDAFLEILNSSSAYMDATRATAACCPPANTTSPIFLSGGVEGTATIAEYQTAFELLRKRRVNIIVPLTSDAAVHSLLATHLVERAGTLRSEANGYVGLGTGAGAGDTLANIKSRIQILGTRHISAVPQEASRNDPDTGVDTFYPPYIYSAILAGMQAGSPIGEPLTHKRPLITDIRSDSSWSPENDQSLLIDLGALVTEKVDNVGIRVVRSITTHLADDNVVFSEMSANESANTFVFEFRRRMETKIGQRGLAGTVAAIKGLANGIAGEMVDDEVIVAYRSLQVEQVGDVFPISIEVSPVLSINFIPVVVHLTATRIAA